MQQWKVSKVRFQTGYRLPGHSERNSADPTLEKMNRASPALENTSDARAFSSPSRPLSSRSPSITPEPCPSKKSAAQSPTTFPNPQDVNPSRPLDAYKIFFFGTHSYLGHEVSQIALTEMFRSLFKRSNVRLAPGPQGQLKKITRKLNEELSQTFYLREDWGAVTPFPVTMKVTWDEWMGNGR